MALLAALTIAVWIAVGALNRGQRSQMFRASRKACEDCGRKWDQGYMLEFHHILAIFEGGSDDESNIVLLCRECHYKRHKDLAQLRRREGNKKGASGHEDAARQIAYRIRTKGPKRYGY